MKLKLYEFVKTLRILKSGEVNGSIQVCWNCNTNNIECKESETRIKINMHTLRIPNVDCLCTNCLMVIANNFSGLHDTRIDEELISEGFSQEHSRNIEKLKDVIDGIRLLEDDVYASYISNWNIQLTLQGYCNLIYTYYHKEELLLISQEKINNDCSFEQAFILPVDAFKGLLAEIIQYYNDNAYHNIYHAFDVLFTGIHLWNRFGIAGSKHDKVVFSLALFMHDIGHLGFLSTKIKEKTNIEDYLHDTMIQSKSCELKDKNNKVHISQNTDLIGCEETCIETLSVEDHGINERMHIKITQNILSKYFDRTTIIKMQRLILSTDLALNAPYSDYITKNKSIFIMIIKLSDLANAAKSFEISDMVGRQVYNEFNYNSCSKTCVKSKRCGRFSLTGSHSPNLNDFLKPIVATSDNRVMCYDMESIKISRSENICCYLKNQINYMVFCVGFFEKMYNVFEVVDLVPLIKDNLEIFREILEEETKKAGMLIND